MVNRGQWRVILPGFESDSMKTERPVCKHCGGENLTFDACAKWNTDTQTFELIDVYGNRPMCQDCETEGWPDWQETQENGVPWQAK